MMAAIKKKLYLVLQPKQSSWEKGQGIVTDFALEGAYVKKPTTTKAGIMIELSLEVDGELFLPIVPNATIRIEKDKTMEQAMTVVTGRRVKSPMAPSRAGGSVGP